jgi:ribosomal protein S12 methylthiotransferase accessory factor
MAMDSPLIRFGDAREGLEPVRVTEAAMERLAGQPLFDMAKAREIVGPLYPLYREPEAHHAAAAAEARQSA